MPGFAQVVGHDSEDPASFSVEQVAEQWRGIKSRKAQSSHSTVTPDEGGGRAVSDKAVVCDRQISLDPK